MQINLKKDANKQVYVVDSKFDQDPNKTGKHFQN